LFFCFVLFCFVLFVRLPYGNESGKSLTPQLNVDCDESVCRLGSVHTSCFLTSEQLDDGTTIYANKPAGSLENVTIGRTAAKLDVTAVCAAYSNICFIAILAQDLSIRVDKCYPLLLGCVRPGPTVTLKRPYLSGVGRQENDTD
jgi:hypothetical protein